MRFLTLVVFCFCSLPGFSFTNPTIQIHHLYNGKSLILDNPYINTNNDTIYIHTLKYYLSNIKLKQDDKIVWIEADSYHLINEKDTASKSLALKNLPDNINFNIIEFNIGIDSATNYDGIHSGVLDPTNGMYWTWQNGYINFKIEGKSNICKTRKNLFQFHIGGYENNFSTLQNVSFNVEKFNALDIHVDIGKLLEKVNLEIQNEIMHPCNDAVIIANYFPLIFKVNE
jgi:hypothetical protein